MARKRLKENGGSSMAAGIGIGAVVSITLSAVLAGLVAMLIVNEKINESSMHYFSFAVLLISTFAGSIISFKLVGAKCAVVTGITALVYMLVLLGIAMLFFDGGFQSVGTNILAIVLGYAASCALCISITGRKPRRKRVSR